MSITRPSQWFQRQASDPFVRARAADGLRARSAFKLQELQRQHGLLRRGAVVLDLGAAPGGWAQVAAAAVGPAGRVVAVDLLPIDPLPGVHVVTGDARDPLVLERVRALARHGAAGADVADNDVVDDNGDDDQPAFDVLLSDMAHSFTGHRSADVARVQALCEFALEAAAHPWVLRNGGNLVCKFLRGAGEHELRALCQQLFTKVVVDKPKASRKESSEAYLVCLGFKRH
ncbi:2' O-ribose methyltransferase [Polyrhizophydium stewartii]|uniref:rRNA methyltransferase 2, mitochondrial n=1 Tax=Polyrhizophydium stewartii TaxID=2732419 RepID=A0ABR4NK20_9FUNG